MSINACHKVSLCYWDPYYQFLTTGRYVLLITFSLSCLAERADRLRLRIEGKIGRPTGHHHTTNAEHLNTQITYQINATNLPVIMSGICLQIEVHSMALKLVRIHWAFVCTLRAFAVFQFVNRTKCLLYVTPIPILMTLRDSPWFYYFFSGC